MTKSAVLTSPAQTDPPAAAPAPRRRQLLRRALPLALLVVLAILPYSTLDLPALLPGPVNSPGSLQLLGVCLVFAGLAATYDLLFGHTGLLSFGHALYVVLGSYTVNIAVTKGGFGLPAALALTVLVGLVVPALLGALALRVRGIAFAMVTLAMAQVAAIAVASDPGRLTGGEEGLSLLPSAIPDFLAGIDNTAHLYWLALAYLVLVAGAIGWLVDSEPGRVWAAIRENEQRVAVLGLQPYRFQLLAFVIASFLAALGGMVHLFLMGGSSPQITTSSFTLGFLLMVVLGGAGTRWGAVVGGILYAYLDHRLGALGTSEAVAGLPGFLRAPLSEPLFVLGALFIAVVYFLPGGLSGLSTRIRGDGR
ncbi:branched-chain amino acid ABC transporter permease [Streptomyces sp. TRM66268-LWL]|uniref:Branched-chain amino acid ABC transporter permease n=1 Tax=Streptomyces polyasparticus TaxID=2767826 RepID=A0ABR7SG87_9ACTN|nr:branched-chain amino acid ABC transporter permease [Streptomyces polyasparticus]MBC9713755.1 branched-chain amino acid ABC transporter permease [Streptomyces polyasparticus]